ncbi:MAG: crossover junction endodeoxyribonuclease RuvC [Phycisphaerales bacterium]
MIFLGIDPGLRITGYGCVRLSASRAALVEAGVFRLARTDRETGEAVSVSRRLVELDKDVRGLLARVRPGCVAVEGLFAHAAHPATAMIMGHARGVILLAAAQAGVRVVEIKPAEVKKFLTGSGRAEKGQMQRAIQDHFRLPALPQPPDVADALAIALCAAERSRLGVDAPALVVKRSRARRTLPTDVLNR